MPFGRGRWLSQLGATTTVFRHCATLVTCALLLTGAAVGGDSGSTAMSTGVAAMTQALDSLSVTSERLLVGAVVDGREVGGLEVIRHGDEVLIPLQAFADLTGIVLTETPEGVQLQTPIGTVAVAAAEIEYLDGQTYVAMSHLKQLLQMDASFDSQEFALVFGLPWQSEAAEQILPSPDLTPDVRAPKATLSALQTDASAAWLDGQPAYFSSTALEGRFASGWWRMRYDDNARNRHDLEEYAWLRTLGQNQVLVGYQRVRLHPLLDTLDLTGIQVATTNQNLDFFYRSRDARELLSRRLQSVTTFRGVGPAGGTAELRIDGVPVQRRTIGIDGSYEFIDVLLPSGQVARIEVYIYDRRNLAVPVAIQEETRSSSDLLLQRGAWVHQGGLGREGNVVKDMQDRDAQNTIGAFIQSRYGVSDRLTIEGAVQRIDGRLQGLGGLVARLGTRTVTAFGIGVSDGAIALNLEADSTWSHWKARVRSQWSEPGFRTDTDSQRYDHYSEIGYRPVSALDLTVIGRSRRDQSGQSDFVLPAIRWRPRRTISLRIIPDIEGRYQGDMLWRVSRRDRISVSAQENTSHSIDITHLLGARTSASLTYDSREGLSDRWGATVTTALERRFRTTLGASLLYSEGEVGYQGRATLSIDPGLLLNVELESDPSLGGPAGQRNDRIYVGLTADLAFAGRRVLPGQRASIRDDRGAIAGTLGIDGPSKFASGDLEGVALLIDGRLAGNTDALGSFYLGRLPAGLHRVQLDIENLPIELAPERVSYIVEVANGAVSRVDFRIRAEYGVAGRVTDSDGNRITGAPVRLVAADGGVVASDTTDRFGLFRVDRVPPGTYTLTVAIPDSDTTATRPVTVVDDYLFGQDLVVPAQPAPSTE